MHLMVYVSSNKLLPFLIDMLQNGKKQANPPSSPFKVNNTAHSKVSVPTFVPGDMSSDKEGTGRCSIAVRDEWPSVRRIRNSLPALPVLPAR